MVTVSSPATHPVAPGAKVTFTVTLFPAATVAGNANPDWLNPFPLTLNAVIVRLVCPLLVRVTDLANLDSRYPQPLQRERAL